VNRLRLTVLAGLLLAAGCDKPKPAAPASAVASAAAPAPRPTDASQAASGGEGDKKLAETWSYSSVGKRDPFRSFLSESRGSGASLVTRCATPLGRYELEQFKLVAVITGLEDPVAMVQAPNGTGYSVRRGSCIGKNGGSVAAVRTGEVVVAEWATRADGTRDRTQTVLSLPKREVINLEESQ
jgi:type IV pilus assembly protein PilP